MSSPRPDTLTRAIAEVDERLGHLPMHLRIRVLWTIVTDAMIWSPLIRLMGRLARRHP